MGKIRRARKGSKVSRFFTHIFEHKNIKRIFGANIALAIIATSFIPTTSTFAEEPEQNIISAKKVSLTTETGLRYPVDEVRVSQGYSFFHPAIDFDGITGDPIYPVMGGFVEAISFSNYAYGNAIIVNHGDGISTLYAHLSKIFVDSNQEVTTKTVIGEMGATGRAYGDHLHFEAHDHGRPIYPYSVLPR
jgi:murein DD-endopeptidase MepM/ murein hydrolase activator NlpD